MIATGVNACRQEPVEQVLEAGRLAGMRGDSPIPGRRDGADFYYAAMATALAAHLDDFDDTHLQSGNVHAGSVALAASLGPAYAAGSSGPQFLAAFALGCEVMFRAGMALAPAHHEEGWQPSSTVGPLAAALASGVLLGLDQKRLVQALAIACGQPLGHREGFGTPAKALHPGLAAASGILAARLARSGVSADPFVFEAPGGFCDCLARHHRPETLVSELGERWELLRNTYKPYPCGVVCHPVIDAALLVHERLHPLDEIVAVDIRCHPLVAELVDRQQPEDGLQARFSVQHAVAAALLWAAAGLDEYEDARVVDPSARALRARIGLSVDPASDREHAEVAVTLASGTRVVGEVQGARGSLEHPLSDRDLSAKLGALTRRNLPGRAEAIEAAVRSLEEASDLSRLVAALTPERPT